MSKVVEITPDNFEEKVLKEEKPVLLDFSAEWCGPCKRLTPIIEELAQDYDGKAVVAHLDVDGAQELAQQYRVMSIPTIILFKAGEVVNQQIGLVPKSKLADMIDSA